jgi:type VI secretion system secreted protein Hcp
MLTARTRPGRLKALLMMLPVALALGVTQVSAAAGGDPIYMKITAPDVPGEAQATKHLGQIEVLSFQFGVTRPIDPVTGLSSGKAKFSEMSVVKNVDRASPVLFQGSAAGTHYHDVILYLNKGGASQLDYLQITLTNVLVSGYSVSGSGELPKESVTFNFQAIEMSYVPQKPDGAVDIPIKAGWDLKTNTKI